MDLGPLLVLAAHAGREATVKNRGGIEIGFVLGFEIRKR